MEPAPMTQVQLNKFKTAIGWITAGGNFRPPQAIGSRVVDGCSPYAHWYPYSASAWATSVSGASQTCASGSRQSPINFPRCLSNESRPEIAITWISQAVKLINTGYTVQLNAMGENPGRMVAEGIVYTLVQCHWHWGSEHIVDGKQYPFEVHCVHTQNDPPMVTSKSSASKSTSKSTASKSSAYGVFGMFYEVSLVPDTFLMHFEDHLPTDATSQTTRRLGASDTSFSLLGDPLEEITGRRLGSYSTSIYSGPLDFSQLCRIDRREYWSYKGSLTTPGCLEAVAFYILMPSQSISQSQLDKFKNAIGWKLVGGNFRPPQPLGSRTVKGCSMEPTLKNMIQSAVDTEVQSAVEHESDWGRSYFVGLYVIFCGIFLVLLCGFAIVFMLVKQMSNKAAGGPPASTLGKSDI